MNTYQAAFQSSAPEDAIPRVRVVRTPLRLVSVMVVAVLVFALWALRWAGPIDLRYDAGVYYVLGTSIASGHGYRIISEPGAPVDIQYPPLLPAIVAAHQKILGTSDYTVVGPWLRKTYAVFFLAYAYVLLALARAYAPEKCALLATVLCLAQANTYLYSDLLFTELPFTLVCVSFALLMVTHRANRHPRLREALGFALASAAFLLRTAGIALLAAWVLEALLRRQWKLSGVRLLLALMPFLAWQGYVAHVRSSDAYRNPAYAYQRAAYQFYNVSYGENLSLRDPFRPELGKVSLGGMVHRFTENLKGMPTALGESVSETVGLWGAALRAEREVPGHWSISKLRVRAPLFILAGMIVIGGVAMARRGQWIPALIALGSAALICSTPWPEQLGRYFAPVAPFLAIMCVVGAAVCYRFFLTRGPLFSQLGRAALVLLFGGVLVVQAYTAALIFWQRHYEPATFVPGRGIEAPRLFYFDRPWADWERAARWVGEKARRDEVVATTSPHLFFLYTGIKAVMPPMEIDPLRERHMLDSVPVTWVIVDDLGFLDISRRYALPAIDADATGWRLVKRLGTARIYQRVSSTTTSDPRRNPGALAWSGVEWPIREM